MRRLMAVVGFVLLVVTVSASAEKIMFPCTGEINTDGVNLRAGRSRNYEIVAKLNKGDRITVIGRAGGWYRVVPPRGVRFWIASPYVVKGKVFCNRLNVRTRPSTSSTMICQLRRGDRVKAIEERGGWTAIEAPKRASLWVSSELIDLVPGEEVEGQSVDEEKASVEVVSPSSTPRALEEIKIPASYEGRLVKCEEPVVMGVRYCLVSGILRKRVVCLLQSKTINLSFYIGDRVRVWGYEGSRSVGGAPLVDVRKLEVE